MRRYSACSWAQSAFLVYSAGQLPTTLSAPLYLLAIPYFYDWSRSADARGLIKGVVLTVAAGAVHHVTLIFGSVLFAIPVLWLAVVDRREERKASAVMMRGVIFAVLAGVGLGIVLLPYWISIIRHPIQQMPIPHASRSDLLLNIVYLTNYFFVPYGMLVIALPFILCYGSSNRRLRPLLVGFWVTLIFGLGGTTPIPKWILGRAFDILTFERFTLSAAFMALPIVGLIAEEAIDRHGRRAAMGFGVRRSYHARVADGVDLDQSVLCQRRPQRGCGGQFPEPRRSRPLSLPHFRVRKFAAKSFDLHRREQRGR